MKICNKPNEPRASELLSVKPSSGSAGFGGAAASCGGAAASCGGTAASCGGAVASVAGSSSPGFKKPSPAEVPPMQSQGCVSSEVAAELKEECVEVPAHWPPVNYPNTYSLTS